MRRCRLIVIALLAPVFCMAGGYDKVEWSMSAREVRKAYPDSTWKRNRLKNGYLYFEDSVLGIEVEKRFHFDDGGLDKVTVVPSGEYKVSGYYLERFIELRGRMREKHGEPLMCRSGYYTAIAGICMDDDGVILIGPDKKPVNLMELIDRREGSYREHWLTQDTQITLQIVRDYETGEWREMLIYQRRKQEK